MTLQDRYPDLRQDDALAKMTTHDQDDDNSKKALRTHLLTFSRAWM
ncbi:hypothetical protein [Chitinophaga filiformis]|nr:hypothetical protein [Chitinophaga filiformis]